MYLIKKKLRGFCAAHRLLKGYIGKCQNLHGHNYSIEVVVATELLNSHDFVIDFSVIKKICDPWVQAHLDHTILICEEDLELLNFVKASKQRYYILPDNKNTTAECMAEHLFYQFQKLLAENPDHVRRDLKLVSVYLFETKDACAIYTDQKSVQHVF